VFFFILVPFALFCQTGEGESFYKKGREYYLEKKFLLAIGSFRKALELGYQDANLFFYLGNSYVANENYDKALEQYKYAEEASSSADFQGMVQFNRAYVSYLKKEYLKSIDFFNQAYEVNNKLNEVYWLKGNAFYLLRNKDSTIKEWETYLTLAPNGRESGNIRKALDILKSSNFNFDRYQLVPDGSAPKTNTEKPPLPNVQPLIDIEGVLSDVKPSDKGKLSDQALEDIEK
jgi:tetratricopeptide (TPR) repeat protein